MYNQDEFLVKQNIECSESLQSLKGERACDLHEPERLPGGSAGRSKSLKGQVSHVALDYYMATIIILDDEYTSVCKSLIQLIITYWFASPALQRSIKDIS